MSDVRVHIQGGGYGEPWETAFPKIRAQLEELATHKRIGTYNLGRLRIVLSWRK